MAHLLKKYLFISFLHAYKLSFNTICCVLRRQTIIHSIKPELTKNRMKDLNLNALSPRKGSRYFIRYSILPPFYFAPTTARKYFIFCLQSHPKQIENQSSLQLYVLIHQPSTFFAIFFLHSIMLKAMCKTYFIQPWFAISLFYMSGYFTFIIKILVDI